MATHSNTLGLENPVDRGLAGSSPSESQSQITHLATTITTSRAASVPPVLTALVPELAWQQLTSYP